MKQFVKVTTADHAAKEYWVNLDHVVLMQKQKETTLIGLSKNASLYNNLYVKETPVQILDQIL